MDEDIDADVNVDDECGRRYSICLWMVGVEVDSYITYIYNGMNE